MITVETSIEIAAPVTVVWARLCDADMPATAPCEFWLLRPFGMPQPLRCELPTGAGGVGQTRRCITSHGSITQRIIAWKEAEHLAFELIADTAGVTAEVHTLRDDFWLQPVAPLRTRLTRRTILEPRGPCPRLRGLGLRFAVRRIHRFTMHGFAVAAAA